MTYSIARFTEAMQPCEAVTVVNELIVAEFKNGAYVRANCIDGEVWGLEVLGRNDGNTGSCSSLAQARKRAITRTVKPLGRD